MIPDLVDGHLPPGRFRCSLSELEARFVTHSDFSVSSTRTALFDGFVRYLAMWQLLEEQSKIEPTSLLRYVWVAGSFASSRVDPTDVDISPVVDGDVADTVRKRGIKKLIGHRESIKSKYGVEVFPITWVPVVSALSSVGRSAQEAAYISDRGKLDDFWQRRRENEAVKAPPTVEECMTRRGYLEVVV